MPDGDTGRAAYLNCVTPGILLMTVAAAVLGTAIVVAMDMTGGIVDRLRTMAIARSAVLGGHVLATLILVLISLAIVLAVAIALGFRPTADPLRWFAAVGVLTLFSFALIWLATALGLAAKSVETASNTPTFLTLLPFLGSGFVPTDTMPAGLKHSPSTSPSPRHRNRPRPADRDPDRQQRRPRDRVVHCDRPRRLPLGHPPLFPPPATMSRRTPLATREKRRAARSAVPKAEPVPPGGRAHSPLDGCAQKPRRE